MDDNPSPRLFTDESARPVAVHTPNQITLHWRDQVKAGLDRDKQLGVLERVSVNEPVEWCSRMIITPKHDGSPRRVVDYSPLNKHTPWQTHQTVSPWSIVSSIPAGKVKSTIDYSNNLDQRPTRKYTWLSKPLVVLQRDKLSQTVSYKETPGDPYLHLCKLIQ